MKVETYQCDQCGALRTKSNHWWVISWHYSYISIADLDHFLATGPVSADDLTVCGLECAHKSVGRLMNRYTELKNGRQNAAAS